MTCTRFMRDWYATSLIRSASAPYGRVNTPSQRRKFWKLAKLMRLEGRTGIWPAAPLVA